MFRMAFAHMVGALLMTWVDRAPTGVNDLGISTPTKIVWCLVALEVMLGATWYLRDRAPT